MVGEAPSVFMLMETRRAELKLLATDGVRNKTPRKMA
jgi:hypothetical protein